jgi:hypothetical protein
MKKKERDTDPHLGALNFPFISVAFIASPFSLQIMKDAGEGKILAVLRWRRGYGALLAGLVLLVLLLGLKLLLLLLVVVGLDALQRAQH